MEEEEEGREGEERKEDATPVATMRWRGKGERMKLRDTREEGKGWWEGEEEVRNGRGDRRETNIRNRGKQRRQHKTPQGNETRKEGKD